MLYMFLLLWRKAKEKGEQVMNKGGRLRRISVNLIAIAIVIGTFLTIPAITWWFLQPILHQFTLILCVIEFLVVIGIVRYFVAGWTGKNYHVFGKDKR